MMPRSRAANGVQSFLLSILRPDGLVDEQAQTHSRWFSLFLVHLLLLFSFFSSSSRYDAKRVHRGRRKRQQPQRKIIARERPRRILVAVASSSSSSSSSFSSRIFFFLSVVFFNFKKNSHRSVRVEQREREGGRRRHRGRAERTVR